MRRSTRRATLDGWRMLRSDATASDAFFLTHRPPAGDFTGRSTTTLEDAVTDALTKASVIVPDLHWFELTQIAGYVAEGRPKSWHVTVRAGLEPEE